MGQLIPEEIEQGRPKTSQAVRLKDLGIEYMQSHRYQQIASVPAGWCPLHHGRELRSWWARPPGQMFWNEMVMKNDTPTGMNPKGSHLGTQVLRFASTEGRPLFKNHGYVGGLSQIKNWDSQTDFSILYLKNYKNGGCGGEAEGLIFS